MARNNPKEQDNIYRVCRLRGNQMREDDRLGSQDKAAGELFGAGYTISSASLKDYERSETIPSPETVMALAEVYGTPELKWLHCSTNCPLGKRILKTDPDIGTDDVYRTYFELVGAFNKISQIETQLHEVISDDALNDNELPAMNEILDVLDQIAENTKELKIWVERRQGVQESKETR